VEADGAAACPAAAGQWSARNVIPLSDTQLSPSFGGAEMLTVPIASTSMRPTQYV